MARFKRKGKEIYCEAKKITANLWTIDYEGRPGWMNISVFDDKYFKENFDPVNAEAYKLIKE